MQRIDYDNTNFRKFIMTTKMVLSDMDSELSRATHCSYDLVHSQLQYFLSENFFSEWEKISEQAYNNKEIQKNFLP